MMLTVEINQVVLNNLIEHADNLGIHYDYYDGVLLDNCIFYHAEKLTLGGANAKYILVKERFLNEWSSDLIAVMTSSEEDVKSFRDSFDEAEGV